MKAVIQKALKVMETEFKKGEGKYNRSRLMKDYLRLQLGSEKEEVFGVAFLNTQFELLGFEKLFRGSVTEASVPPRAIIRKVFEYNASRIVLAHNHPSGKARPSDADIELTKKFKPLFDLIDCPIIDHVIVSALDVYAMADHGYI